MKKQGSLCFYCSVPLVPPKGDVNKGLVTGIPYATIDHLRERGKGGSNSLTNLVLACVQCHVERHK